MRKYFRYVAYIVVTLSISGANAGVYEDFFIAVNRDDGDTVSKLVSRGLDPSVRNPVGQTALHLALRDQSPRVAAALWTQKALEIDALNASGETPLMMAALRGDLTWSQRLVERGARIHKEGWSPLHYAATGPEPRVVALLLDKGAPIDALSPSRSTPLMMAVSYGAEANVDLLIARGADKRLRNEHGLVAATLAERAGRAFLVQRLSSSPR
jgi:ankyrin repeat protein